MSNLTKTLNNFRILTWIVLVLDVDISFSDVRVVMRLSGLLMFANSTSDL